MWCKVTTFLWNMQILCVLFTRKPLNNCFSYALVNIGCSRLSRNYELVIYALG